MYSSLPPLLNSKFYAAVFSETEPVDTAPTAATFRKSLLQERMNHQGKKGNAFVNVSRGQVALSWIPTAAALTYDHQLSGLNRGLPFWSSEVWKSKIQAFAS